MKKRIGKRKILDKPKGKLYKQLARCKLCKKRYVVDKDWNDYNSKYHSRYYCKECYRKVYPKKSTTSP